VQKQGATTPTEDKKRQSKQTPKEEFSKKVPANLSLEWEIFL